MPVSLRAACLLAIVVSLAVCGQVQGATSAENNPFAPTADQVNARFTRVQQEVDRLRAAGLNNAADAMAQSLQHFRDELAGTAPSLVNGPELDGVSFYEAGNAVVNVHASDRPIVLALGSYDVVNWTLNIDPGARLQSVVVSGYDGVAMPQNVPANVPVQMYSNAANGSANLFRFFNKSEAIYAQSAKTLLRLTGLPPSSLQGTYSSSGTSTSVGAGAEWRAQRVLFEMQPLYNDATAFQLAQDRAAAQQYRFTGLNDTYNSDGNRTQTRVAQMTPRGPIGTVFPAPVNYRQLAVDPRGPTYYGLAGGSLPVKFDPITGQVTQLPPLNQGPNISAFGITFDTKRNRLVVNGNDSQGQQAFFVYSTDAGTWSRLPPVKHSYFTQSVAYSEVDDALYMVREPSGPIRINRYDPAGQLLGEIPTLSQYITCGFDSCQIFAVGDRLVIIPPPMADLYDPSAPLQVRSFLIDPATGNVTSLGVVPEPATIVVMTSLSVSLLIRRRGQEHGAGNHAGLSGRAGPTRRVGLLGI